MERALLADEQAAVAARGLRKRYESSRPSRASTADRPRRGVRATRPNGAGKPTTVDILEGYRRRTEEKCACSGSTRKPVAAHFGERVGIVTQEGGIGSEFTVRESIALYSAAYPSPLPVDEAVDLVGLENVRDARVGTLSGGQRRRLDLALAVAGDPELIFLDEPTTGFDPSARRQAWLLIDSLRSLGKTILLTTHYMDEAQNLADRSRSSRTDGSSPRAARDARGARERQRSDQLPGPGRRRRRRPSPARNRVEAGDERFVRLSTDHPTDTLRPLLDWAAGRSEELEGLTVIRPTLEDVYLELTEAERWGGSDLRPRVALVRGRPCC